MPAFSKSDAASASSMGFTKPQPVFAEPLPMANSAMIRIAKITPADTMASPRSLWTNVSAMAAATDPTNWPSWMHSSPQPTTHPVGTLPREASTGHSAHSTM